MNWSLFVCAASAGETWQAVPLISLHFPVLAYVFWCNIWALTVTLAVLAAVGSHVQNHAKALAGNTAITGLRKAISLFWHNQTLERVQLKSRSLSLRGSGNMAEPTNRLTSAWVFQNNVQRKTTGVWLVVIFSVLLTSNLFGLVPLCQAITGQAGTTLGFSLALLTGITYAGIQRQGMRFVKLFLPSGPSWPMAPVFVLLESISYAFRGISLGVRLWANMLAGHQLIHLVTALALVPALCVNILVGAPVTALAAGLLMALSGLEAIVCVLQSGVFCLLASFYLHEVLSRKQPLASGVSSNSLSSISISRFYAL
uniref:ATP synthase subunit 6 n=1 Tax=Monoraphidium dybowskii TaxID=81818 RepID=UPI0022FD9E45|nr:ATP synthase subunit 6 [Monoraphidium dybowskii]